ncbi:MAG: glycosyltransferase [Candidatus Kerfeldbacteria bacterium]
MDNNSLISIIIRVKNEEAFIGRCLDAVFQQKSPIPFEVVIVFDETSTDNTRAIIQRYPVRIIKLQEYIPKYTMPKAMNVGIREAKGDIIVMLSGDAIPLSDSWLATLIGPFKDHKVAAVGGRMVPRNNCYPMEKRRVLSAFSDEERMNWILPFAGCAVRKSVLEQFPIREDLRCGEDKELKKRIIDAGYFIPYLPNAAVEHSHNMSLKRHFLIGMKRGQSYNKQGFLPPELTSLTNTSVFIVLIIPRFINNLFKKVWDDYKYIKQNKEEPKWYLWAWPYEMSFLVGHYIGPIYYRNRLP